jgi:hypothetical protein
MTARRRIPVPVLAILLTTSACGGGEDSGSEAASVFDLAIALGRGTPEYTCDIVPGGARCWLSTDETQVDTSIAFTGVELNDPQSPVATIYAGDTAEAATVETVAATLGVPNDDRLWVDGAGFVYTAP